MEGWNQKQEKELINRDTSVMIDRWEGGEMNVEDGTIY